MSMQQSQHQFTQQQIQQMQMQRQAAMANAHTAAQTTPNSYAPTGPTAPTANVGHNMMTHQQVSAVAGLGPNMTAVNKPPPQGMSVQQQVPNGSAGVVKTNNPQMASVQNAMNMQTLPIRSYLDQTVVPILMDGA